MTFRRPSNRLPLPENVSDARSGLWTEAERCRLCSKRMGFIRGLKGFGLRQREHEKRCRVRLLKSAVATEVKTCPHVLQALGMSHDNGWKCDGLFGICESGVTGFMQTRGMNRFRCGTCDFDLCEKCFEASSASQAGLQAPLPLHIWQQALAGGAVASTLDANVDTCGESSSSDSKFADDSTATRPGSPTSPAARTSDGTHTFSDGSWSKSTADQECEDILRAPDTAELQDAVTREDAIASYDAVSDQVLIGTSPLLAALDVTQSLANATVVEEASTSAKDMMSLSMTETLATDPIFYDLTGEDSDTSEWQSEGSFQALCI